MPETRLIALPEGRSLALTESGTGSELLLIHGSLATRKDWIAGPMTALSGLGRTIAVDRPGHGESKRRRFDSTPRDQARQIREGLDEAGLNRPLIIAHSMGAMVALAYAELFPDRLSGLLLIAPFAFPEPRPMEHWLLSPRAAPILGPWMSQAASRNFDPLLLRQIQTLMFDPDPVPAGWQAAFPYDEVLDPRNLVAEGEDFAALAPGSPAGLFDYSRIGVPVRIAYGSADRIIDPNRHGLPLARLLPDAETIRIDGGGHMIHHSHTDVVLRLVSELT